MAGPDIRNRLREIAPGLYRFDTGYVRPGHTACFIVLEQGRAAIIDCGVAASVADLMTALALLQVEPDAVDHLIVTHVHLDHAGASGHLMALLPSANLSVHPSGAPHLVDPSRLEEGVRMLYGDDYFDREYGTLRPVDMARLDETPDNAVVRLGSRELRMIHTPGHAWHHQSILDTRTATVIAGDAFGVGYAELNHGDGPFVIPVVPPPQFKPEVYRASVERIVGLAPARVALTHFDVLDDPARVGADLNRLLDDALDRCRRVESAKAMEDELIDLFIGELDRRGRGDDAGAMQRLYAMDIWLTAEGMWLWRRKQDERAAQEAGGTEQ